MLTSLSTLARVAILLLAAAVGIIVVGVRRRIPQDPAYHDFADDRAVAGIPNFWNVASNLPFAVVGILGLTVLCEAQQAGILPGLRAPFATFFSAAILVAAGSAYYHLHPNNSTLVWDRLPMTIGFMSFFTIVLGEHLTPHLARRIFVPLLAIGVGTVLYWVVTEYAERSDLRPYLVIQFLPLLLTPLILILFPSRLNKAWLYWLLLSAYAVAKVAETFDRAIYERTGFVSGHTLKHLLAAAGMLLVVIAARDRKIVAADRLEPGASNPRLQWIRSAPLPSPLSRRALGDQGLSICIGRHE